MSRTGLILTPIFDPYVGGAAVHFDQISRGLTDIEAVDSYIIVSAYSSDAPVYESIEAGRVFRVLFSPSSIHNGWSKPKIAMNYIFATVCTLLALLIFRTSIVHTHTKRYFTIPVRVAKAAGAAIIVDGRDLGAPSFGATGDVFVAASVNIAQKAEHRKERIVQIPIGIDPEELAVDCTDVTTPAESYVLFVGDITERKGVPELLAAFEPDRWNRKLVLIGEQIDNEIEVGQRDDFDYLGPLPHAEVLCYIQDADLVVLPSKEEALGRIVLESVFHETPAICPPDVPEFHRSLPDKTLTTVSPSEIRAMLGKILKMEDSSNEYPIEKHYIPNVIEQYDSVYKSLDESV